MANCDCCTQPTSGCSSEAAHTASITLPVRIRPSAAVTDVSLACGGQPTVSSVRRNACNSGGSCYSLVITQPVTVTITLNYGAEAASGEANFCGNT